MIKCSLKCILIYAADEQSRQHFQEEHLLTGKGLFTCFSSHVHLPYGKCSKISNTFLFLFLNKMLVIRAGIHKMHLRIVNGDDPDQTASSEMVRSGSVTAGGVTMLCP